MSTLRCAAALLLLACFVGFCESDVTGNTDRRAVVIFARAADQDYSDRYTYGSFVLTFQYAERSESLETRTGGIFYGYRGDGWRSKGTQTSTGLRHVDVQWRPSKGFPSTVKMDGIRIILSDGYELCARNEILGTESLRMEASNGDFCWTAVIRLRSAASDQQPAGLSSITSHPFVQLQYEDGRAETPMFSWKYSMTFEAGRNIKRTEYTINGLKDLSGVAILRYDGDEPWKLDSASVTLTNVEGDSERFCSTNLTLTEHRNLNLEYQSVDSFKQLRRLPGTSEYEYITPPTPDPELIIRLRSARRFLQPSESASTTGSLTLMFVYDRDAPATSKSFESYEMGHVELSAGTITELPIPICNNLKGLERVDIQYRPHDGSITEWKLESIKFVLPRMLSEFCASKTTLSTAKKTMVFVENPCMDVEIRLWSAESDEQLDSVKSTTIHPMVKLHYENDLTVEKYFNSSEGHWANVRLFPYNFEAGKKLKVVKEVSKSLEGLKGVTIKRMGSDDIPWKFDRVQVDLIDVEGGRETFCNMDFIMSEYRAEEPYLGTGRCHGGA